MVDFVLEDAGDVAAQPRDRQAAFTRFQSYYRQCILPLRRYME